MIALIQILQLFLLASTIAHRVEESSEDTPVSAEPNTTTTLYPVNTTESASTLKSATSWKIETSYAESKLEPNSTETNLDSKEVQSKEVAVERPANSSQEFRPSPHLGSFLDEDSLIIPTREADFSPVIKKPPIGFTSSSKEKYKASLTKFPQDIFKNYQQFPYKFEPAILTKAKHGWKPCNSGTPGHEGHGPGEGHLETRPTAEVPVRVPAGGLYKDPDPFKEKPGFGDDDFGLEFSNDGKEHGVKKPRVNPMKNLLHFLTALIPVGIIFSALTPSVINIGPDHQQVPANVFRRGDGTHAQIPPISERCRRRLLCELHSDTNYSYSSNRGKKCHRIPCEDPESLSRALSYLLAYHQPSARDGDHFT